MAISLPLAAPELPVPAVAGQFMTWPATVLAPDDAVGRTLATLAERGTSHALIKAGGRICGVVCQLDLLDAPSAEAILWKMTIPAAIVSAATPITEALELLAGSDACGLAVDAGGGYGFMSREDALAAGAVGLPACSACGDVHRVVAGGDPDLGFCMECSELMVRRELDDLYLDLGVAG